MLADDAQLHFALFIQLRHIAGQIRHPRGERPVERRKLQVLSLGKDLVATVLFHSPNDAWGRARRIDSTRPVLTVIGWPARQLS